MVSPQGNQIPLITIMLGAMGLLASGIPANADIAASFSLPQQSLAGTLLNGVDGFDFTPSLDLTVTALGWFDQNGDGLIHDHPVGIYLTSTQTLVAPSALVTTLSTLDAATDFRFTSVTPFTLTAGSTYTLAGYGSGPTFDDYVTNPAGGVTFGLNVSFVRLRASQSSELEFPTTAGEVGVAQNLSSGPNFLYSAVPEPASLASLFVGTLIFWARPRTRSVTNVKAVCR